MMLSSRYALTVVLLLALALVPTIIHSYLKESIDDGISVDTLIPVIDGYSSKPFSRHNAEWVKDMFDSEDWMERIYTAPDGKEIRIFVTRSYNFKRLYHHPELGLSHGSDLRGIGVVNISEQSEIPVHLLRENDGQGLAGYVLLSEGIFVDDPVLHQITNSLKQLVSASRLMTLFYVSDTSTPNSVQFNQTSAAIVLKAAIESFTSNRNIDLLSTSKK